MINAVYMIGGMCVQLLKVIGQVGVLEPCQNMVHFYLKHSNQLNCIECEVGWNETVYVCVEGFMMSWQHVDLRSCQDGIAWHMMYPCYSIDSYRMLLNRDRIRNNWIAKSFQVCMTRNRV
jgi:hypothetical protein